MAENHRRVELQEASDLRYLIDNVRRSANAKIDLALPPIEGEDALRSTVEELVHGYIASTFTLAAPNISINGHVLPPSSSLTTNSFPTGGPSSKPEEIEEYEPFSEKLRDRAAKLLQQEEELLLELAQLRREAPIKAKGMWQKELAWVDELSSNEAAKNEGPNREIGNGDVKMEGTDDVVDLRVDRLERQQEVEASWKRGTEGLVRLKGELPQVAAKMERARRVGEYVLRDR